MEFSRRSWLRSSLGAALAADIAAAQQHAHQAAASKNPPRIVSLDAAAAEDVRAIAAQIVPSGDGPGAEEAGVIFFIDRALATFDADKKTGYRAGLAGWNASRKALFPSSASIAALSGAQLRGLIGANEKSDFFELIRMHTMLGFLGSPAYGGNRGKAGWKLVGFEDRMVWQPPFGAYDAEDAKK